MTFYLKSHILLFCLKKINNKKRWTQRKKNSTFPFQNVYSILSGFMKNDTFCKNCRFIIWGFCSISIWNLSSVPIKKALHFVKFITIVVLVFLQLCLKCISFERKKKKHNKQEDVHRIKNVTFCENCGCSIWAFCWISVWNLNFCSFWQKKQYDLPFIVTFYFVKIFI